MFGQFVEKSLVGRRFAISDVHGCADTLQMLLTTRLQITPDDQVFLLGDYINRGPNSAGVLQHLIDLQNTGFQVFPIRGNHEQMLLNINQGIIPITPLLGRAKDLTDENRNIFPHFFDFLNKMSYFIELDKFFLVHAGLNLQIENPLEDTTAMLWSKYMRVNEDFLKGKQVVHGHHITHLEDIRYHIRSKSDVLPLDNGCYKGTREKQKYNYFGNLCALNLDTFELIVQKNIDKNLEKDEQKSLEKLEKN